MMTSEDMTAEVTRDVLGYLCDLCASLAGMEDAALDDQRPDLAKLFEAERHMVERLMDTL